MLHFEDLNVNDREAVLLEHVQMSYGTDRGSGTYGVITGTIKYLLSY